MGSALGDGRPARAAGVADAAAFERVYSEHARGVYLAAYAIIGDAARAQDIVQEVFLRLWRDPGAYEPERGSLGSYLRMQGRSRAVDLWREERALGRARTRLGTIAEREELPVDERPAAAALRASESSAVQAAVCALPKAQREAVVLVYWADMTAEQVARHCAVPVGTAKGRLRLALARLRGDCARTLDAGALADAA